MKNMEIGENAPRLSEKHDFEGPRVPKWRIFDIWSVLKTGLGIMKFWGAILEDFGILFGTGNAQKWHQIIIRNTIKPKHEKKVTQVHAGRIPLVPLK